MTVSFHVSAFYGIKTKLSLLMIYFFLEALKPKAMAPPTIRVIPPSTGTATSATSSSKPA